MDALPADIADPADNAYRADPAEPPNSADASDTSDRGRLRPNREARRDPSVRLERPRAIPAVSSRAGSTRRRSAATASPRARIQPGSAAAETTGADAVVNGVSIHPFVLRGGSAGGTAPGAAGAGVGGTVAVGPGVCVGDGAEAPAAGETLNAITLLPGLTLPAESRCSADTV
jgi:hypothetical protein